VSNRRRTQPPNVVRAALAWRCPDCSSENGKPGRDTETGVWRLPVMHDPSCPGLLGVVPMPALYVAVRGTTP
jgi:hypothetical protein